VYEAKFEESAKMGLKLELRADPDKYPWPGNDTDSRPLFEKYQFFTPGLFPSPSASLPSSPFPNLLPNDAPLATAVEAVLLSNLGIKANERIQASSWAVLSS
jgi:hypothetical protein